jgi:hypothetical protein
MYVVPRSLAIVTEASTGKGLELAWVVFNAVCNWSPSLNRGFCRRYRSKESIWPPKQCECG